MRYTHAMDKYGVLIDEAVEDLRASGLVSRAAVIASEDRSLFDVHLLASDIEAFIEIDTEGRKVFYGLSFDFERENGPSKRPGLAIRAIVYEPNQSEIFDAIVSQVE